MIVELIMFDIFDFNTILYMDFLSWYGAEIAYQKKKVRFHKNDGEEFIFSKGRILSLMINNIKARKLLSKGCTGYLAHVIGKDVGSIQSLQFILIVYEFQDMFLYKLLGLAQESEVKFDIEFMDIVYL